MTTVPHAKQIVFCDFDGTITQQETFVSMLHHFAPEKMQEFGKLFSQKKTTLRLGVRGVVESIPSRFYGEMVAFIKEKPIRPGFKTFLKFLADREIPFYIISGGLKDSVQTRLAPFMDNISGIYAPMVDDSGEFLKMVSEYEAGDELMAKVKVMETFSFDQSIAIGDGATDQKIALSASLVFARDRLSKFLETKGVQYIPWEDFHDIKNYLENIPEK